MDALKMIILCTILGSLIGIFGSMLWKIVTIESNAQIFCKENNGTLISGACIKNEFLIKGEPK